MLISRPSAVVIAGTLVAMVLVWVIIITPIFSESHYGRNRALDYWRSRLVPKSYARDLLDSTPFFTAFDDLPGCGYPESEQRAWYTMVSAPNAERQFVAMLARGGPASRLYAISGLAFLNSPAFQPSLGRLQQDTVTVRVAERRGSVDTPRNLTYVFVLEERAEKQAPFGPPAHRIHLAALLTEQRVRLWARLLAHLGSRSCAT